MVNGPLLEVFDVAQTIYNHHRHPHNPHHPNCFIASLTGHGYYVLLEQMNILERRIQDVMHV